MRSARVDLPWSMWAMMQKFLMIAGSVAAGTGEKRAIGDTVAVPLLFTGLHGGRGHKPRAGTGLSAVRRFFLVV
ncbi:hypothetical protein GCM10017708_00720 [Arthrobacter citreus]